jgi:hypothetical protein
VPVGLGGPGEEQIESGPVLSDVRRDHERSVVVCLDDGVLDEGAKAAGENFDREKECAGRDVYPAAAIEREAAAGNDTMNVGVKDQGLAPGVKHGEDADVCAKRRGRDIDQGLASGAKQNRIEDLRRVLDQRVQTLRDGEDDMEVGNVEDLFAPLLEPVLAGLGPTAGTMAVAARVPEGVLVIAPITLIEMSAHGLGAAVGDRAAP